MDGWLLSESAAKAHRGTLVRESSVPTPVRCTAAFEALALLPPVATDHSSLARTAARSSCWGIQRGKNPFAKT